jgi:hypothetical protein
MARVKKQGLIRDKGSKRLACKREYGKYVKIERAIYLRSSNMPISSLHSL